MIARGMRNTQVCKVAPVPGETKVWQYITLMMRIFLIVCPGVVYNKAGDSETDAVLKGVVRVENLADATEHIGDVLQRVKPEYLVRLFLVTARPPGGCHATADEHAPAGSGARTS